MSASCFAMVVALFVIGLVATFAWNLLARFVKVGYLRRGSAIVVLGVLAWTVLPAAGCYTVDVVSRIAHDESFSGEGALGPALFMAAFGAVSGTVIAIGLAARGARWRRERPGAE